MSQLQQRKALDELAAALDRFIAERPDHPASVTVRTLKASLSSAVRSTRCGQRQTKERKLLHAVEEDLLATLPVALQSLRTATEAAPFR